MDFQRQQRNLFSWRNRISRLAFPKYLTDTENSGFHRKKGQMNKNRLNGYILKNPTKLYGHKMTQKATLNGKASHSP